MDKFKAAIGIIGINPFVYVPERILNNIFKQAGKERGHIPVRGMVNDNPYKQTLVKYSGAWRLYINTIILKKSPDRIGEKINVTIEFDPVSRKIKPHAELVEALNNNKQAKSAFASLSPSRQNEIVRYISQLKTAESITRNVNKAISYLLGEGSFVGRNSV